MIQCLDGARWRPFAFWKHVGTSASIVVPRPVIITQVTVGERQRNPALNGQTRLLAFSEEFHLLFNSMVQEKKKKACIFKFPQWWARGIKVCVISSLSVFDLKEARY